MRSEQYMQQGMGVLSEWGANLPRKALVGGILMVSLLAFEMFNFDTTQYALGNLLGDVDFLGLRWASILAIAFCSIDFAGLIRLFTPERGADEPREVWYLMGAWLLGATMNAIMTWWAVSLTLLNHSFGNEVLSREELLRSVPIFVAVLVWLTRILFIGAFTVAGDHLFDFSRAGTRRQPAQAKGAAARTAGAVARTASAPAAGYRAQPASQVVNRTRRSTPAPAAIAPEPEPVPAQPTQPAAPLQNGPAMPQRQNSRVRQRPPRPNGVVRRAPAGMQANGRNTPYR